MSKDDYFVLAYRILSYLYACFKAGEQPDMDCISADVLHIPVGYWFNIMRSLTEEGYIVGLVFPASIGSAVSVKVIDLRITQKGIEFLQENSKFTSMDDMIWRSGFGIMNLMEVENVNQDKWNEYIAKNTECETWHDFGKVAMIDWMKNKLEEVKKSKN